MTDFVLHCLRCGCQLKVVLVRVPTMNPTLTTWQNEVPNRNPIAYEEREEVSDCPRCTGSY